MVEICLESVCSPFQQRRWESQHVVPEEVSNIHTLPMKHHNMHFAERQHSTTRLAPVTHRNQAHYNFASHLIVCKGKVIMDCHWLLSFYLGRTLDKPARINLIKKLLSHWKDVKHQNVRTYVCMSGNNQIKTKQGVLLHKAVVQRSICAG